MNQGRAPEIEKTPVSQCLRCRVNLLKGQAFAQPPAPILDVGTDTDFKAKLVGCMKCPRCGYSESPHGVNELRGPTCYMSETVRAHYEVFGRTGLRWNSSTGQYFVDEKFAQR